jgi:hypothetical protein
MLENVSSSRIYTVEHSKYYLSHTQKHIVQKKNVEFLFSPIKLYLFRLKRFATYEATYVRRIPRELKFDLVLIDGPLGYKFGREAPLYQIVPFLKTTTLIILDDANRQPEQEAISNWKRVWLGRIDVLHFPDLKKGLAVIQIENPSKMAFLPFSARQIWHSWQQSRQAIHTEKSRAKDEG